MRRRTIAALAGGVGMIVGQAACAAEIVVGAATDHRQRGLSWSAGRPTAMARATQVLGDIALTGGIAGTRGSVRHGGADAAIDVGLSHRRASGAWRWGGGVTAYAFPGGRGGFVEGEAGGGVLIGPVQIDLTAAYAPPQRAIGGDNLYLSVGMTAAIPTTPFTLLAGAGRTSGRTDDPARAARLRPGGVYIDYWIGADHIRGPARIGLRYTGTSGAGCRNAAILTCDRHVGGRFAAQVAYSFP